VADERLLRFARELEARDERLATAISEVDELQRSTDRVRARAAELAGFLERLPRARAAAEEAVRDAEDENGVRRRAHAEAQAELARAGGSRDEDRVAAARRAEVRTRDALSTARRKLERALEARDTVERQAEAAALEAPELDRTARALAGRLARMPRVSRAAAGEPDPGLAGTVSWSDRAHAALFVVRGGLDTERERVVREANELAASALGEPVAATSVAGVRERLERS
jgi:chromosome segregation ATPase